MKNHYVLFLTITGVLIFFSACNSEDNQGRNDTTEVSLKDTSLSEVTADTTLALDTMKKKIKEEKIQSKYICPLGDPEGNKNEPGICPVCEMELIENPDYINKTQNK